MFLKDGLSLMHSGMFFVCVCVCACVYIYNYAISTDTMMFARPFPESGARANCVQ